MTEKEWAHLTEEKKKEKEKWEKRKFALKSIVAEIDTKVVELGFVGGHLLSRLADKGLRYCVTSNPVERSIVWTMTVPESISQLSPRGVEIAYLLLVYGAEEFSTENESSKRTQLMVMDGGDPHLNRCWQNSQLIMPGCTLGTSCQYRKKLTRLSVNANGSLVPKDSVYKNLIKESLWLKALLAIPKVQPRFALAIKEKYPTMKSLLQVYMDPRKSVQEKEFLLEDLPVDGGVDNERRYE
ncbi:hypothetical protein SLA2020_179880 [Shorea laevis]